MSLETEKKKNQLCLSSSARNKKKENQESDGTLRVINADALPSSPMRCQKFLFAAC